MCRNGHANLFYKRIPGFPIRMGVPGILVFFFYLVPNHLLNTLPAQRQQL